MITVITPSYNRAAMITTAIESVAAQDSQAFEHIIVDGGSTDNTLEVLKQYPHLKIVTEEDRGMYDALNKGLKMATGEIIGFLNTDDMYAENIFSAVVKQFDDPDIMAVAGRAIVISELSNGTIEIVKKYSPQDSSLMESSTIGSNFFNAWFFRKSTFDRIGAFNADYKIAGDQDLMLRFALNNLKYVAINDLVYKYRMHQDSLTFDKDSKKLALSADENLAMIDFYLVKRNLPDLTRKLLIQRQTLVTVHLAARNIWMGNYKKFICYSSKGLRYNFAWPVKFFQYVIKKGSELICTKGPKTFFE